MHWTPETRIKPFAGLPAELRLIIYAHVMEPEPKPSRRALIEVLKHSRALNDDLEKALENSEKISLFADRHDWKRFIELRSYPLLELGIHIALGFMVSAQSRCCNQRHGSNDYYETEQSREHHYPLCDEVLAG